VIDIPYPEEGTYVIGGTGTRKSTLLLNLMVDQLRQGHAFALLDPHKELARDVATHVDPKRRIVLDLMAGFGINPFACPDPDDRQAVGRVLDRVQQAFAKLWGASMADTPLIADYLTHAALPMILTGGTMVELRRFLLLDDEGKAFRWSVLDRIPGGYGYVREFWRDHDAQRPNDRQQNIAPVARRVRTFLTNPILEPLFSTRRSAVDWRRAMDEGTTVLVMLDAELEMVTGFVGALILGEILSAVLSRADTTDRRPYGLYVDEYDRMATPATAGLFTQGRKYKIRPLIAHQHRGNLEGEMRRATLQVANVFVLRVAPPDDNKDLAGIFDASPPEPEVRGYEPVRGPVPQVLEALLRSGHRDEHLQSFVDGWLRTLQQKIDTPTVKGLHNFVVNGETYLTSKDALREGMRLVERLLYLANRKQLSIQPADQGPMLAAIVTNFRAWFGLGDESRFPDPELDYGLAPWQVRSISQIEEELETPQLVEFEHPEELLEWMTVVAAYHALDLVATFKETLELILTNPSWTTFRWVRSLPRQTVHDTTLFAWKLLGAAGTLKRDPMLAATGQIEPQKERPRSREDVLSQIANELATLPSGIARIRIRTSSGFRFEEYTIPPPPPPGPYRLTEEAPTTPPFQPRHAPSPEAFDDASPAWRWETVKAKPTARAASASPGRGWRWERVVKPPPPKPSLVEQAKTPREPVYGDEKKAEWDDGPAPG
jgi:hypothetical protein